MAVVGIHRLGCVHILFCTFNQQLDDDELRTNLAWWPYTESHLNNENNSQLYSLAKAKDRNGH